MGMTCDFRERTDTAHAKADFNNGQNGTEHKLISNSLTQFFDAKS